MVITSNEAAKKLCHLSNWSLTNLQLQKLLYLSHLYFLGQHGKPLISSSFEAWKLGPVMPSVYNRTKIFKDRPVLNIFYGIKTIQEDDLLHAEEASFLKKAYVKFMNKTAFELVTMTHQQGGAWEKAFNNQIYSPISERDIIEEYQKFYKNDKII